MDMGSTHGGAAGGAGKLTTEELGRLSVIAGRLASALEAVGGSWGFDPQRHCGDVVRFLHGVDGAWSPVCGRGDDMEDDVWAVVGAFLAAAPEDVSFLLGLVRRLAPEPVCIGGCGRKKAECRWTSVTDPERPTEFLCDDCMMPPAGSFVP